MFLALQSDTLPLSMVDEQAQTLAQRISMVNGVAQVNISGSQKYAVRIDVDPQKLAAHGIGIDEVATAITNANVNLPTGTMYSDTKNFVVQANGQLLRAAAYGPIIIAYRNGNPVRLNEVAHVYDGVENDKQVVAGSRASAAIYLSDQQAAGHERRAGRRRHQDADAHASTRSCPPPCRSTSARTDRSSIRESVSDVKFTLLLTMFLVVAGDLPVPAERVGDDHPQPGAARLDRRDLRRDVPARLQPRQPVADGAHALGRASSSTTRS